MKIKIGLILIVIVLITSCKKNLDTNTDSANCLLQFSENFNNNISQGKTEYFYDDQNRVSGYVEIYSSGSDKGSLSYSTSNIIFNTAYIENGKTITQKTIATLDISGRISKIDESGYISNYKYNADGYLMQMNSTSSRSTFIYKDGNLIQIETIYSPENKIIRNYTYSSELNKSTSQFEVERLQVLESDELLLPYYGKSSKNLLNQVSKTQYFTANGLATSNTGVTLYNYESDDKGNIISIKTQQDISSENKTVYTYKCK